MSTVIGIGRRLRLAREWAGFTQQTAADTLGVARELISYWENERRSPGLARINQLADTYGMSVEFLLGEGPAPNLADDHARIYRALPGNAPQIRAEVRRWLAFLDDWADVLAAGDDGLSGRRRPPVNEWAGPHPITDSRRAERLALEVRAHYQLGLDAIPDLTAFLDRVGVLVYKVPLGPIDATDNVSGIFYNHPRLGYTALINSATTAGRQALTLAHELAHALFHYQETSLVCRHGARTGVERFADVFAAHFLVPSKGLRAQIEQQFRGSIERPEDVVRLQHVYLVSFAMLLNRLLDEGFLTAEQYSAFAEISPGALAVRLGLATNLSRPSPITEQSLARFAPSVLGRVRSLIERDELTPAAAASLLDVAQETLLVELLAPPTAATEDERREFRELPQPDLASTSSRS